MKLSWWLRFKKTVTLGQSVRLQQLAFNEGQLSVNENLIKGTNRLVATIITQQKMIEVQHSSLVQLSLVVTELTDTIRLVNRRVDEHVKQSINEAHDTWEH